MKKLSILASVAAIALATAAPVAAQEMQDLSVSTQDRKMPAIGIIGGIVAILVFAATAGD